MGKHQQQWLKQVIAKGVAMLLLLRLKNSPREDVIQATLEAWYQVITYKKIWDIELDKQRFEAAFMIIAQTCDWFPTPKQLLDVLPPREYPKLLKEKEKTEEEELQERLKTEKNLKRLRAMLKDVCKK
ncbi:hypothetical protein CEP49_06650 [Mergibacter septicus]|uniref:hypothetical protein n=1 Tax=Mergibacter septicus TaxID=221402 RepID=UPI001178E5C1|nr:hypothetical protein [Mergibacter septicus]AWX14250.1 hypothetical protein CEP49_06650 [Mergibacter septicus]